MKTSKLVFALSTVLLASSLVAGDEVIKEKKMRVLVDSDHATSVHEWVHEDGNSFIYSTDDEMPAKTFLGVETTRVGATLGKQLGLDRGIGLIVARVVPDTGAAEVLEKHDLLVKFEDQLLVSSDQLGVLVQSKEPGTAVELTVVRDGEEQVVTAVLSERKSKSFMIKQGSMALPSSSNMSREELKGLFGDMKADGKGIFIERHGDDTASIRVMNINHGTVVFTDEDGTVKLISDGDGRRLVVVDEDDNEIFNGPVESDEQREALSDAVKMRLKKVESLEAMEMADEDFEVEEDVQVLVPHASHDVQVIRLPGEG